MAITVKRADITKLKNIQAIVNAANGLGVMGRGVAGAIRRAAGEDFSKETRRIAMEHGGYDVGQVYVTGSGNLAAQGIESVLHAVTMKYPGSPTSYAIVDQCIDSIFKVVKDRAYTSVAIPGLGTGVGHLDPSIVARQMIRIASMRAIDVDVRIVDLDVAFIDSASLALSQYGDGHGNR